MQGFAERGLRVAVLGLLLGLGGCGWFNQTTAGLASTVARTGEGVGAPWGGERGANPGPDLTIQRVRVGQGEVPLEPLRVEPGDVWPQQEAPRATLINPDAALRGVPDYQPDLGRLSERPPPVGPTNRLRGSAGIPQPALQQPPQTPGQPPLQSLQPPGGLPPAVVETPRGGVVPYGGGPGYQTYTAPGGGTGVITRDGGLTTIRRPDGGTDVVPTPR